MTPAVCPVHNLPWKWVPGGVSKKTGKAYQGFHTCPERGCEQRPKADAPAAPPSPPQASPARSGAGAPTGTDVRERRLLAALSFAGAVHQGGSDGLAALVTAREAFKALMAGLPTPAAIQDGQWEPVDDVPNFD